MTCMQKKHHYDSFVMQWRLRDRWRPAKMVMQNKGAIFLPNSLIGIIGNLDILRVIAAKSILKKPHYQPNIEVQHHSSKK